jgi:hypothetical protein
MPVTGVQTCALPISVTDTFGTADTNYWTVSKALLDAASPTDVTSLITSKSESDSFAVGDSLQTLLGKGLSDTSTPSDTIERMVQFQRAFTDVVSIDDFSQVDKQWSGTKQNVAFTSDLSLFGLTKAESDGIALSDSALLAAQKVLSDTATLSETFLLAQDFVRSFSDSVALVDSADVSNERGLTEADSVGFADLAAWAVTQNHSDSLAPSDVSTLSMAKGHIDTISIAETFLLAQDFVRSFADTIVLTDSTDLSSGQAVNEFDSVGFSDASAWVLSQRPSDTTSVTDSSLLVVSKASNDALSATDVFSLSQDFVRNLSDSIALSDSVDRFNGRALVEADNAATSDIASFVLNSALAETVLLSDVAAQAFSKPLVDTAAMGDSVAYTAAFQRAFSDVVSLDDISNVDKNWDATKQNVAFTSDSAQLTLGQNHTDSALIDDAYAYAASKALTDSVGSIDAISIQLNSGSTPVFNGFTFNSNTFG